jgi:hypothetical protein
VCSNKEVVSVQTCSFSKTYRISDIESMNGGLFDRFMKGKLCRNIEKIKAEQVCSFVLVNC